MTDSGDQQTPRIALAVSRDRNRELLTQLLHAYETVPFTDAVPDGTDFCIIDEHELSAVRDTLTAWQADQHPRFAPVVLLSQADTDDPWARYSDALSEVIDSIVQVPAAKATLATRIENLLEMRSMSKDLVHEHQLTKLVFDTSPLAKLVLDADGTIVRANQRATEVFGVPTSDLVGRHVGEGDWTAVEADGTPIPPAQLPFERVLATGEPVYEYEHRLDRPDHDPVWLRVNMAPIRDDNGDIEYVVATFEDITVQRSQKLELDRQLDLFERAQAIANVGAWEYDVRADTAYWTAEVYRIHGLDPVTDPSPAVSLQHYHPEDRPAVEAAFERAVEGGDTYDIEARLIDADGDQRWVRTRGEPQFGDGEVVRVRGTLQDITDRKERELELRRMTDAVDEAPIGVTLTDPSREDNPMVYVNEGFVEVTGYSREAALGRNCRFLQGDRTDPETVARIRRAIAAEQRVSVEVRNYRADGTEFWNRLEIAPVRDADGEVINYIGFQQDVTEEVEHRQQLHVLDRYLRHNLRNEMNVVYGMAEEVQQAGDRSVSQHAVAIKEAAANLLSNMDKEREITRLLRSEPVVGPVAVSSVVQAAAESVREAYPAAEITVSGAEGVLVAATDNLAVVFEELLENAVRHNPRDRPEATVEVTAEETEVVVEVGDNGPGTAEMETAVLTGGDEETTLHHGQGLGLWLVYLVLRRCGGTARVTSSGEEGTEIRVTLPNADAEELR